MNTNAKAAPTAQHPVAHVLFLQMKKADRSAGAIWSHLAFPFRDRKFTEEEFSKITRGAYALAKDAGLSTESFKVYLSNMRRCVKAGIAIPQTRAEYNKIADSLPHSGRGPTKKEKKEPEGNAELGATFAAICEDLEIQPGEAGDLIKQGNAAHGLSERALVALRAAIHRTSEDRVVAMLTALSAMAEAADEAEAEDEELAQQRDAA